jgi:hypothetical protein
MSEALRSLYLPKKGIFVMKARISLRILRSSRSVPDFLPSKQNLKRE